MVRKIGEKNMNTHKTKQKGAQLERVHAVSTQVVDTRNRQKRRGTILETNFTVKRNETPQESKFLITNVVDHQMEKQVEAEAKQNRTFVKPKFQLVYKTEIEKVKRIPRGKERASNFAFFKEMFKSNQVKQEWNVKPEKEIDEVDLFFMKKKTKPFSSISIKELGDSLTLVPDDKHTIETDMTSQINEPVVSRETVDVFALSAQVEALMKRVEMLEKENETLKQEKQDLAIEKEKFLNEMENSIKNQQKEKKNSNKIEEVQKKPKKVRQQRVVKQLPKKVAFIAGEEQCLDIESSIKEEFKEKPMSPKIPSKKDQKKNLQNKIRQWYTFDKKKIQEHQEQVLQSVRSDKTFAEKVRENGIPKQKIRYVVKPEKPKQEKQLSIHHYGYKPAGIPKKIWWKWVTNMPVLTAYERAERFLFNMFKREMMMYRHRWSYHSKEFNPYLSEPKMVWEENTMDYELNTNVPYEFIKKWRQLVTSYNPSKPISKNWYVDNRTKNVV